MVMVKQRENSQFFFLILNSIRYNVIVLSLYPFHNQYSLLEHSSFKSEKLDKELKTPNKSFDPDQLKPKI